MRLTFMLLVLATLTSPTLLAQQPPKMPSTAPATGSPGTATPQPYSPVVPQHLPSSIRNNPPLLKQAPLPEASQPRRDQDVPLLQEQRERNVQPVQKSGE